MAQITAAMVKSLRDKTQLPMMECKQALQQCDGDEQAAIDWLREQGKKTMGKRADRSTDFGYIATFADVAAGQGAMVEVKCESGPVASSDEFIGFARALAKQLATGPGAGSADELLAQNSPDDSAKTLAEVRDDMANRIREVFNVGRILRIDAPCGSYSHHTGTHSALVEVEGSDQQLANEIAMHVVAMRPAAVSKDDLDAELVEHEKKILSEAARKEGKPENIIEKMVEGRLRNFFAERVLTEQPFVKDEKQTVGKVAAAAGLTPKRFTIWELGKED